MIKTSKLTRWLLTGLVLVAFLAYFFANASKFRPLLHIDAWLLLVIAGADIVLVAANGLFTKFILRPFGKFISLLESFYVSLISSVGNFFAPVGAGFGFRAIYLKKRHGLPYGQYISTLSGNYIVVFLVNSFFGLVALYLLRARANHPYDVLLVAFAITFIFSVVLSIVKIPHLKSTFGGKYLSRFINNLHTVTDGWNHIIAHRRLILQLVSLTTFNFFVSVLVTFSIIKSLHLGVGLPALFLFAALNSMSTFINITPANLGIKEAIYLFSGSVLGFSTSQILSIALIDRGVQFFVLLGLWLVSSKIQTRFKTAS